jgi:hypothetical protein
MKFPGARCSAGDTSNIDPTKCCEQLRPALYRSGVHGSDWSFFQRTDSCCAVALLASISLLGACGTGDSAAKTAERDRRAAELNKAAATSTRAALARRRAVLAEQRAAMTTRAPSTPTTIVTRAATTRSGDLAAIESMVDALNAAFRSGVASGIKRSATANYWVGNKATARETCMSFESARGQGVLAEQIVVHPSSLEPAPGWVDPMIGTVPGGRTYRMVIDEIQTLVTSGQQRARTLAIHVNVGTDGRARLFLRCQ